MKPSTTPREMHCITEEMRSGLMIDVEARGTMIAVELLEAFRHRALGADLDTLIATRAAEIYKGQAS